MPCHLGHVQLNTHILILSSQPCTKLISLKEGTQPNFKGNEASPIKTKSLQSATKKGSSNMFLLKRRGWKRE